MALSNEWEEMHLTPSGWKEGSYRYDNGGKGRPRPDDAVLTIQRRVVVAAIGAPSKETEERTPHTEDEILINELLAKFGEPSFGV